MASPQFEGIVTRPGDAAADMMFVPVFQGDDALDDLPGLDEATGGEIQRARASAEFRGKLYEFFITRVVGGWKAGRIALVGAGRLADADPERIRKIAAACGYTARLRAVLSIAWVVRAGLDPVVAAEAAADGLSAPEFD
jgi:hypothetical protein